MQVIKIGNGDTVKRHIHQIGYNFNNELDSVF